MDRFVGLQSDWLFARYIVHGMVDTTELLPLTRTSYTRMHILYQAMIETTWQALFLLLIEMRNCFLLFQA